jgi:tetratricopeptide (TPR) repeat protein
MPMACCVALVVSLALAVPALLPAARAQSQSQSPSRPAGPLSVQVSPQLFATMCALYAAGLPAESSVLDADPAFVTLVAQLRQLQGPATVALRDFYRSHVLADSESSVSPYIAFALVAGPPPDFKVTLERVQLPPDVLTLDGFSEILANFYKEAQIDQRWRLFEPAYQRYAEKLNEPLGRTVTVETSYLREIIRPGVRTFTAYAEPLVGSRTDFRNIGDRYIVVANPSIDSSAEIRHAFLHFLLDPLPLRYSEKLVVQSQLLRIAGTAPRLPFELRNDWLAYFTECLVRAAELRVRNLKGPQLAAELDANDADGYVLVRPLMAGLAKFEASTPSMTIYFPDLTNSIDVGNEQQRLKTVTFAPASQSQEASAVPSKAPAAASSADLAPDLQSALSEGERDIAGQHPAAAQAVFERVLQNAPGQPRALYGLAVAFVLQGNKTRARELFGQAVAATSADSDVLAWSHVYLGRIYDLEGSREEALNEYKAALAVADAPEAAHAAARRGLDQQYQPAGHDPTPG